MIAAIISIAWNQLTRLHAVFALIVTGSPVSVYLVFQTMRSIFFKCDVRLEPIFGKSIGYRGILNRAISILAIPFWVFIFATVVRPGSNWFTQSACDRAALSDPGFHYSKDDFYDGSVAIFVGITVAFWLFALPFAGLFCLWVIIACFIKRKKIRNRPADANYFQGAWRVISEDYPFTRFALLILLPFTNWVLSLEMGSNFSNEEFTPSVGQVCHSAAIHSVMHELRVYQASSRFSRNSGIPPMYDSIETPILVVRRSLLGTTFDVSFEFSPPRATSRGWTWTIQGLTRAQCNS